MSEMVIPTLCGGIFLALILESTKPRKAPRSKTGGGEDPVSDQKTLERLFKIVHPELIPTKGKSWKTITNGYKSCKKADGLDIVVVDKITISAFDKRIRTEYSKLLSEMGDFVNEFIETAENLKLHVLLAARLLYILEEDRSIKPDQEFIFSDGRITKSELIAKNVFLLQELLLSVWHFIVMNRVDNTIGKATYDEWWPSRSRAKRIYGGAVKTLDALDNNKYSNLCIICSAVSDDAESLPTNDGYAAEECFALHDEAQSRQNEPPVTQVKDEYGLQKSAVSHEQLRYEETSLPANDTGKLYRAVGRVKKAILCRRKKLIPICGTGIALAIFFVAVILPNITKPTPSVPAFLPHDESALINTDIYQTPAESFNMALNLLNIGEKLEAKEIMEAAVNDTLKDDAMLEIDKVAYLCQLGEIYFLCGETDKANTQFNLALAKMQENGLPYGDYALMWLNLARTYVKEGNTGKALMCVEKAKEYFNMEDEITRLQLAHYYSTYGSIYQHDEKQERRHEKSIAYFFASLICMSSFDETLSPKNYLNGLDIAIEVDGAESINISTEKGVNRIITETPTESNSVGGESPYLGMILDFRLGDYNIDESATEIDPNVMSAMANDTVWNLALFDSQYSEQEITVITESLYNMSIALLDLYCYTDALDVLILAEKFSASLPEKYTENKARISHVLGAAYKASESRMQGSHELAIEKLENAIDLYEQGVSENIMYAYIDLASCYSDTDKETEQRYIDLALEKCADFYSAGSSEYKEFERLYGKRRPIFPF